MFSVVSFLFFQTIAYMFIWFYVQSQEWYVPVVRYYTAVKGGGDVIKTQPSQYCVCLHVSQKLLGCTVYILFLVLVYCTALCSLGNLMYLLCFFFIKNRIFLNVEMHLFGINKQKFLNLLVPKYTID